MKSQTEIQEHYKGEAKERGLSKLSTMPDLGKRERELGVITDTVEQVSKEVDKKKLKVLDAGCGNGYALERLRKKYPSLELFGVDLTPEMVELAKSRNLSNCSITQGRLQHLPYSDETFDMVYTERAIQNLCDWKDQKVALGELYRVLKKDGYLFIVEGFTDGQELCNKARVEVGLEPLEVPPKNLLLQKDLLLEEILGSFEITRLPREYPQDTSNFLSSYEFVRLVLHPLVTKGEWIRNTEFVKFLGEVAEKVQPAGNYSRTQAYLMKKV